MVNKNNHDENTTNGNPKTESTPVETLNLHNNHGSNHEITPSKENDAAQTEQKGEPTSRRMSLDKKIIFGVQLVLAVCALGGLGAIYSQLSVMSEQTDIFQSQLINQTRAWITVKHAAFGEVQEGQKIKSIVKFINSGNSPALNMTIHNNSGIRYTTSPEPDELVPIDSPNPSKAVVGPQVEHNAPVFTKEITDKRLIDGINEGTLYIYVWGVVKYEDIFGIKRETGFRLKSVPKATVFKICKDGNYAN